MIKSHALHIFIPSNKVPKFQKCRPADARESLLTEILKLTGSVDAVHELVTRFYSDATRVVKKLNFLFRIASFSYGYVLLSILPTQSDRGNCDSDINVANINTQFIK
jgi:hypothetical protein